MSFIEFKWNGDPASVWIMRDGDHVGYVQWHEGEQPRIVIAQAFAHLTLSETRTILSMWERGEFRRMTGGWMKGR